MDALFLFLHIVKLCSWGVAIVWCQPLRALGCTSSRWHLLKARRCQYEWKVRSHCVFVRTIGALKEEKHMRANADEDAGRVSGLFVILLWLIAVYGASKLQLPCSLGGAGMQCQDLRQSYLPAEPRDPARCPEVHRQVSPMMRVPLSRQPRGFGKWHGKHPIPEPDPGRAPP